VKRWYPGEGEGEGQGQGQGEGLVEENEARRSEREVVGRDRRQGDGWLLLLS